MDRPRHFPYSCPLSLPTLSQRYSGSSTTQKLSIYEASYKDWTIILGFAVEWGFPEIEELALRELNTFPEHHESHDLYQEIIDQLDDFRRVMHQDTMRAVHRHLEDDHSP